MRTTPRVTKGEVQQTFWQTVKKLTLMHAII